MVRALVVYDSKFGNTKSVAKEIRDGLEYKGVEAFMSHIKGLNVNSVPMYDLIVIGSPTHFGGPAVSIKKLMKNLGKMGLKGKKVAVFDTCIEKDMEKVMEKLEASVEKLLPECQLIKPGLSVVLEEDQGPISDGYLERSKTFGRWLANWIIEKEEIE